MIPPVTLVDAWVESTKRGKDAVRARALLSGPD